jgi:D-galactarolactone isomerase
VSNENCGRRDVLKALGVIVTSGSGFMMADCANAPVEETEAETVPWSAGTERPRLKMPADATDSHHHIYDPAYPWTAEAVLKPGAARVDDYRKLQKRLGTSRNVIVQPSSYGVDNRLLLASLAQFAGRARGVAVVNTSVTDADLRQLHDGGVRGIRFNLAQAGATTVDMVRPLAARVAPMGWHVQVNAPAERLLHARAIWLDLPCPVVFDHLAHVPEPDPTHHAVFLMVTDLISRGRGYVKLSGFYNDTRVGPPSYSDRVALATAYASAAPNRVLWGSDWPHPTEQPLHRVPDDALMLDLLQVAIPDESKRHAALVDNPAALYGFA